MSKRKLQAIGDAGRCLPKNSTVPSQLAAGKALQLGYQLWMRIARNNRLESGGDSNRAKLLINNRRRRSA